MPIKFTMCSATRGDGVVLDALVTQVCAYLCVCAYVCMYVCM